MVGERNTTEHVSANDIDDDDENDVRYVMVMVDMTTSDDIYAKRHNFKYLSFLFSFGWIEH